MATETSEAHAKPLTECHFCGDEIDDGTVSLTVRIEATREYVQVCFSCMAREEGVE